MGEQRLDSPEGLRHDETRNILDVDLMHASSLLCIASGLSWPKVGVIMAQSRGYRGPNFFHPFTKPYFFNSFWAPFTIMHAGEDL